MERQTCPAYGRNPQAHAQHAGNRKGDLQECFGYLLPVSTADLENEASAEIESIPMFEDDIFFAAPEDSHYARLDAVDQRLCRDDPFVSLGDGFVRSSGFAEAFQIADFTPNVVMRIRTTTRRSPRASHARALRAGSWRRPDTCRCALRNAREGRQNLPSRLFCS